MKGDLTRLCIHTMTMKPWSLRQCVDAFEKKGVPGISIWRNVVEDIGISEAKKMLEASSLEVVSYVRGGFFPHHSLTARGDAISHNMLMVEEAAMLGAPLLVLVCGADPKQPQSDNVDQIMRGIEAILPVARDHGVILGIEPLHPMYADTRSAISTLGQAIDVALRIGDPLVQVVMDVYHLWWDHALYRDIHTAAEHGLLSAYHICDWKVPTTDMLNDRGLMGEGCIDLVGIEEVMTKAGYDGYREVEIFSDRYWSMNQERYVEQIIEAYLRLYDDSLDENL